MTTQAKPILTPWRVVQSRTGSFQIWTKYDDAPGSRNNYVVADGIQSESEAHLLAQAPALLEALQACLDALTDETGNVARREADACLKARAAIQAATGGDK